MRIGKMTLRKARNIIKALNQSIAHFRKMGDGLTDDLHKAQSELANLNRQRSVDLAFLEATKKLLDETRAGNLLKKGSEFVCVDSEEPYYMTIYRQIRQAARLRGTWTPSCEKQFRVSLDKWLDRAPVKERDTQFHSTMIGCNFTEPK